MIFNLAQKHYFFELERKDRINQQASLTVAVAALYFSLIGVLAQYILRESGDAIVGWIFFVISISFGISFIVKFFHFFGHVYTYIADTQELEQKHSQATMFDRSVGTSPSARAEFLKALVEDYAYCAGRNQSSNERKSLYLLQSNRLIFLGLIFGALSYYFFLAME